MTYELIVIGGGPAGYLAAERAGQAGLSVLLVEKRSLGGVCLNEGCIPSKALLYSAKIADNARDGAKYGVLASDVALNHPVVIKRKNKVVRNLVSGVKAKMRKNKVTVVEDTAYITGRSAEGYQVKAGDSAHTGRRLLIASGSVPIMPPIPGVKEGVEAGLLLPTGKFLTWKRYPKARCRRRCY